MTLAGAVRGGPSRQLATTGSSSAHCSQEHVFWRPFQEQIFSVDEMYWSQDFDLEMIWCLNMGNGMKWVSKAHFSNKIFKGCC